MQFVLYSLNKLYHNHSKIKSFFFKGQVHWGINYTQWKSPFLGDCCMSFFWLLFKKVLNFTIKFTSFVVWFYEFLQVCWFLWPPGQMGCRTITFLWILINICSCVTSYILTMWKIKDLKSRLKFPFDEHSQCTSLHSRGNH